jgi:hypothetical protein
VSYGPHPLDEFFAIAMMKCITVDLRKHYNFNVAVECWDVAEYASQMYSKQQA